MKIFSLVILVFSMIASSTVQAKNDKPCRHQRANALFTAIDKNNNGEISLSEFKAHTVNDENIKKRFARLDKDKNGLLDDKELARLTMKKKNRHQHR